MYDHVDLSWGDRAVCAVLRHWLPLFLIPLLIFVTLPFIAPLAMKAGWTNVGRVIYTAYLPFCHQLPQRSWFLFGERLTYTMEEIGRAAASVDPWRLRFFYGTPELGWKVAWSDRMISLYFLTPVFGLVYAGLRQMDVKVRPLPFRLFLASLLPLFLDGITHVLSDLFFGISSGGFRDTNAWLAILTDYRFAGLYAGDHYGTINWWLRLITGVLAAAGTAWYVFPSLDRLMQREYIRTCVARSSPGSRGSRPAIP